MPKRRILFICKASIKDGLGHLIRTKTLADFLCSYDTSLDIHLVLITNFSLNHNLAESPYQVSILEDINQLDLSMSYESIVLDMLRLEEEQFLRIRSKTQRIISISPIFDQLEKCDLLITRTKYHDISYPESLKIISGLNYSIIRSDCTRINTSLYKLNLDKDILHIAISMGGTDPNNNTLKLISRLKALKQPTVFWILLGEGYEHHYEDLVKEINQTRQHEIILAKTNKSMWQLMNNCNLAILAGGITSYEAIYAGLPAINYFQSADRSFLVKELEENDLCLPICYSFDEILTTLQKAIETKNALYEMHLRCIEQYKINPLEHVASIICNFPK